MYPHRRWVIALAVSCALLVAAIASLRPAKEAARDPAPIASPNDNSRSAGKQSQDDILWSPDTSTDRDSVLASVPQSLPPVVFDFPDADPRLVEPATIQEFFTLHPKGRHRVVTVNGDEIREVIRDKLRGVDREVEIPLFPDTHISARTLTATEGYLPRDAGSAIWSGVELGGASSYMYVAIGRNENMTGEFHTSLGTFGIAVTMHPPFHIIWQWPPEAAMAAPE